MTIKRLNDAGHGGTDPGAVANGIVEKDYALEAAQYVNRRLVELGIESGLTRNSDVALEPNARTALVRATKAPFGLSHHYNAGGGAGAEFIHSIHSDGKFEHTLADEFRKAGYPVRRVFCKPGANGKDYYFMQRETGSCRMTIVEYDFVDGPNAGKLKDKAYREGMYECVVRAVCREEGVLYKPVKEVVKASDKKPDYAGSRFEASIKKAIGKGVIEGFDEKTFKPNEPLTRGQFAAILDRLGRLD